MPTTSEIDSWLRSEYSRSALQVKRIPFRASRQWKWNESGFLSHRSNRFFNVVGIRFFSVTEGRFLAQPIIDQPEIGMLAFVVCDQGGKWSFLAHAKVEPGNVNGAQIAPTVQATRSNYEAVHGGERTHYLGLVLNAGEVLYDGLQSEQNSRFLGKRNRNKVVKVAQPVSEDDTRFKWIPAERMLRLLGHSHTVNTDARSVITCWLFTDIAAMNACLPAGSRMGELLVHSAASRTSISTGQDIENWLDELNGRYTSTGHVIAVSELGPPWECGESAICAADGSPMQIHQIDVSCKGREVTQWDQPIAASTEPCRMVLIAGSFEGTLHFLVQAKLEAGNRNGFELTTTVQTEGRADPWEEKYAEIAASGRRLLAMENSDEGGRFDHCIGQYEIVWTDRVTREQEGSFHRWISLSQFGELLRKENRITNELRSAASTLLAIEVI